MSNLPSVDPDSRLAANVSSAIQPQRGATVGWIRLLPAFPVACGVVTAGVIMLLGGNFESESDAESTGVTAGQVVVGMLEGVTAALLVALPLAALISLGKRYWSKGMLVVAAGCFTYTAATLATLIDVLLNDSSTAALALAFLPVPLGALLVLTAAAAALMHRVRRRPHPRG